MGQSLLAVCIYCTAPDRPPPPFLLTATQRYQMLQVRPHRKERTLPPPPALLHLLLVSRHDLYLHCQLRFTSPYREHPLRASFLCNTHAQLATCLTKINRMLFHNMKQKLKRYFDTLQWRNAQSLLFLWELLPLNFELPAFEVAFVALHKGLSSSVFGDGRSVISTSAWVLFWTTANNSALDSDLCQLCWICALKNSPQRIRPHSESLQGKHQQSFEMFCQSEHVIKSQ